MEKPTVNVVIGIIENKGRIVCVKQVHEKETEIQVNADDKKDFLAGLWHMPGGKARPEEDLNTAMLREAKEEVGLDVEILEKLGERIEERDLVILHLHWFLCKSESEDIKAGDDADEAQFIPKKEVPNACAPEVVAQWPEEVEKFFGN